MAKKVGEYQFSRRFKKEYSNLPNEIKKAFDEKLTLRVKRILGTKDRWEGSVTMKYRFTFQFFENKVIFRAIGTHDILTSESR